MQSNSFNCEHCTFVSKSLAGFKSHLRHKHQNQQEQQQQNAPLQISNEIQENLISDQNMVEIIDTSVSQETTHTSNPCSSEDDFQIQDIQEQSQGTTNKLRALIAQFVRQTKGSFDKQTKFAYTFIKQFAHILDIDLLYTRTRDNTYQYNASPIIEFNQQYKDKFIPLTLEIDFDAFYPQTLLRINNGINPNVRKLMTVLQDYRNEFKTQNNREAEKAIKVIQNCYVGTMGSRKQGCNLISDLYAHSLVMENSRQTLRKLMHVFEEFGKIPYFVQTDACFAEIDSIDQIAAIYEKAQQIFPCKFKIHHQLYHFKQMHKYVSLIDDCSVENTQIKAFTKDCQWMKPYIHKFITDRDPQQFLKIFENPQIHENTNLIGHICRCIQSFPSLIEQIQDMILIRVDHLDSKKYIKRFALFVKQQDIESIMDKYKKQFNNMVSFHEVMIRDQNALVFDIDCKDKIDVDDTVQRLRQFINSHPMVCALFDQAFCQYSSYTLQNKTSIHIKFDIQLPIQVQKEIATDAKLNICQYIDLAIYSIGKSLRMPNCANVKPNKSQLDIVQQQLVMRTSEDIQEHLFTTKSTQKIREPYLYECLVNQQTTFPYQYKYKIENPESIQQLIQQQLTMKNITVYNVIFTKDNLGEIHIRDDDKECIICQRKHTQKSNRSKLTFTVNINNTITIGCYQYSENAQRITITYNESEIKRSTQMCDDPIKNAKIIDQKYILKNKTDKYTLPYLQMDIIRSPLGSGKSEYLSNIFKTNKKVLMLACRKVYSMQNLQRFQLTKEQLYWNTGLIDQTCIVQVESLKKVNPDAIYNVIILDEFMSILQQLYKEDKNQSVDYCSYLIRLLRQCERIIVLDATLTQSAISFLTSHLRHKPNIIDNAYKMYKHVNVTLYKDYKQNESLNYIAQRAVQRYNSKEKSWIIISSKSEQIEVAEQLHLLIPGAKIKLFNSDQDSTDIDKYYIIDNKKRQIINNIELFENTDLFNEIDIVITTSSITSGLNIDIQAFDYVICNIQTGQFSPQQLVQALFRCRHVKNIELFSQDLQTNYTRKTFFDNYIKGITYNSNFTLDDMSEKLYCLARQYIYDLNVVGLHYVKYQLQNMGCNVREESFQLKQDSESEVIKFKQQKKEIVNFGDEEIIKAFMYFIPRSFETDNQMLLDLQTKYKDEPRGDYELFKKFINLSLYQVQAQFKSDGYHDMFDSECQFEVNPSLYTQVLKQYICIHGNPRLYEDDCDDAKFEKLMLFVIQYTQILKKHGKVFLQDFYSQITRFKKFRQEIEKFINSADFDNKKSRYRFYRDKLQIEHEQEKGVDNLIHIIKNDNLLQYNSILLAPEISQQKYDSISRRKIQLCSFLGFAAKAQRIQRNGVRSYILVLFDDKYMPDIDDDNSEDDN